MSAEMPRGQPVQMTGEKPGQAGDGAYRRGAAAFVDHQGAPAAQHTTDALASVRGVARRLGESEATTREGCTRLSEVVLEVLARLGAVAARLDTVGAKADQVVRLATRAKAVASAQRNRRTIGGVAS